MTDDHFELTAPNKRAKRVVRKCSNPRCQSRLLRRDTIVYGLCPSCQYVGRIFFAVGAGLVGLIAGLVKWAG